MKKSRIFKIAIIVWILLFIAFAVYKFTNAPIFCWDSQETDPVTGETHMIGSCDPDYRLAVMQMVLPFVVWLIVLVTLFVSFLVFRKR